MPRSDEHLHPEGAPQLPETPVSLSSDADSRLDNMELKAISELAYTYWEARGRPWGIARRRLVSSRTRVEKIECMVTLSQTQNTSTRSADTRFCFR